MKKSQLLTLSFLYLTFSSTLFSQNILLKDFKKCSLKSGKKLTKGLILKNSDDILIQKNGSFTVSYKDSITITKSESNSYSVKDLYLNCRNIFTQKFRSDSLFKTVYPDGFEVDGQVSFNETLKDHKNNSNSSKIKFLLKTSNTPFIVSKPDSLIKYINQPDFILIDPKDNHNSKKYIHIYDINGNLVDFFNVKESFSLPINLYRQYNNPNLFPNSIILIISTSDKRVSSLFELSYF